VNETRDVGMESKVADSNRRTKHVDGYGSRGRRSRYLLAIGRRGRNETFKWVNGGRNGKDTDFSLTCRGHVRAFLHVQVQL
jgi:hypothetical protein